MTAKTDFKTHLSVIDGATERMVETITGWANMNSGSGHLDGICRVADSVVPAFEAAGLESAYREPDAVTHVDDGGNVIEIPRGGTYHFSNRPNANRRILLTGHLDTVFPKEHPFQKVKRKKDERGEFLHGPGTADMKGGICVMLEAIKAFEQSPFADAVGIDVLLNSDEETGSHASAAALAEKARGADIGLVFEPALPDGTLAGARAGSGHYTFTVRGKSAHAGREFHLGRNAIVGAAKVIEAINELNGQRDGTTLNLGVINGGQATNVVPDTCVVRMNIRGRSPEDLNWADENIHRVIEAGGFGEDIAVELHGGIHRPVKADEGGTRALFELVKSAGADLGIGIDWKPTGGCCDGNNLAAAGLPNVDTLGVVGGAIHSPDEYAIIDSFVPRAKLASLVMMLLASGEAAWPDRLTPQ
ncbi:hydrolase [Parvularcula flava]|uniref:Acetylornithine deacetylase n=1 Tax=Aquisalinus luteolus TaxID=1566827 RepID=A0A8J3A065_9PROT|nr:hydrolase [Aquisalinus luteolus]NHK26488.1 hydrolase [Aquisalinus luteolus]GGH92490.1 acetylornithine deacetylase [Aquisalinus luteolus]